MPLTTTGQNLVADAKAGLITAISLHNGDPGDTGANEVSGGGYARQEPSYGAASGGAVELTGSLEFSGPSEQPVSHLGWWAGTDFFGSEALTGDAAFNAAGEYEVTEASVTST